MSKKVKPPQCVARCKHCGSVKELDMQQYSVGDELIPYPGGGDYGYCWKCKKKGMIIIEVPRYPPKGPVGWVKT